MQCTAKPKTIKAYHSNKETEQVKVKCYNTNIMDVFLFSKILATGILFSHIAVVVFFITRYTNISITKKVNKHIEEWLKEKGWLCALIIAICSVIGPLTYTYLYHLTPCTLCWFQRICMFPLAILLLIANIKKDFTIKIYIYTLSTLGLLISVYHFINQQLHTRFAIDTTGCDAVGLSKGCSEYYLMEYGYITIPVMAATGFILIIFFTYFAKEK